MKKTLKWYFSVLSRSGFLRWIPTKLFLRIKFKLYLGNTLNLKCPKTFNEKLQWLKIYYAKHANSLDTQLVDKITSKRILYELTGSDYSIPTLGIWDHFDDITFNELPEQFVLKTNHDSGGVVIVKNKKELDKVAAKKKLEKSLRRNFYWSGREPQYKRIVPHIFAEPYFEDGQLKELRDYKFFCFNGVPRFYKVDFDRFTRHRANYYDMNSELVQIGEVICPPDFKKKIEAPQSINKMKQLCETLSKGYPFLRVDFYEVNGEVYIGEITFFPASGFGKFCFPDNDLLLGQMIQLPVLERNDNTD